MKALQKSMQASVWSNGSGYYGLRIGARNRNTFFRSSWKTVTLETSGKVFKLPLTASFWRKCPEIRGAALKQWIEAQSMTAWPKGHPPKATLRSLGGSRFRLCK